MSSTVGREEPEAADAAEAPPRGRRARRAVGAVVARGSEGLRAAGAVVPWWVRRPIANPWVHGGLILAALLIFAQSASPLSYNLYVASLVAVYAIAALGLNIPGGMVGALSLGHGGSFALGMYSVAILSANHGWAVWAALPVAIAFGLGVGLLMGAPAGRIGAIGLAMVSLGYSIVIGDMVLQFDGLTGGTSGVTNVLLRVGFNGDAGPAWVVPTVIFALMFVVYIGHWYWRSSRFGRAGIATRDESIGASVLGVSPYGTTLLSFAVGSAIGAIAGGLFAYLSLTVTPSTVTPQLSILFLVMIVLGGAGSRIGPVVGAAVLTVVPLQLDQYQHVNTFVYGALLVLVVLFLPRGIVGRSTAEASHPFLRRWRHAADRTLRDAAREQRGHRHEGRPGAAAIGDVDGPLLAVRSLSRSFGEVRALVDVDFALHAGQVLGVVGPNGSGKTTLLNVISGLYPADAGAVALRGTDISGRSPNRIAHLGVSRTFQTPKVFPGLSIAEHLALAAEHRRDVRGRTVDENSTRTANELLRMGGLDPDTPAVLERPVAGLSQGQLRFLEVAVAAYRGPHLLLLDEPAAGLSGSEIAGLERATRTLADQGVGVIIVEHHLDLVRRLVDRVVVMHLGGKLWEGEAGDMESAEDVRRAYLGIQG
jgi:branched-chain amino acid transport system permease protein